MIQLNSDALMMASEPALLCRGETIVFANGGAMDILGKDCVGKSSLSFFGGELVAAQASSFVVNISVKGKHYIARASKSDGLLAVFFVPDDSAPILISEAFIYALRSQLMNISVTSNILRERAEAAGDTQTLENLSALTRSYYSISRLMNNAATVRGIELGDLPINLCRLNMSEACAKPLETLQWLYKDCEFSVNTGKDISLLADPSLISLLMLNLLSNCLAHGKNATRIAVTLFEAQGSVILSVSDDGCGIPQDQLHSVFDRYRHCFDMKQLGGGAGLGLTVARGIAALHGGTLMLESREGHGATVRASFKKDYFGAVNVKSPQMQYGDGLKELLIGLADVLPSELYKETYLD